MSDLAPLGFTDRETEVLQAVSEIARRHQAWSGAKAVHAPEDLVAHLRQLRQATTPLMVAVIGDQHGWYGPPHVLSPKERARAALPVICGNSCSQGGSMLIVAHKHLVRSVIPTQRDLEFSADLARLCRVESVDLADHVIVGPRDWISLRRARALDGW